MLTTLFGLVMCIGFVICYIPSVWKLYKTKSSGDIALGQYYWTICGYIGGLLYMWSLGVCGFWLTFNYLSGIGFCIWVIFLCKKYKN